MHLVYGNMSLDMKLYHFHNPYDFRFAQALRRGTWYPKGAKICPECHTSRQTRVSPLIIEWESGSDLIGDFVCPGDDELVVTQKVRDAFEGRFSEIEFGPVEFWQDPKLKKPKTTTRRSKPRVWLPYTGPTLWDTIATKWCHLNHAESGITIEKICQTCGKTIYKRPPWPERHLVVNSLTWTGEDIFHIYEYSGAIFCTERVKEFVERSGFTNISFLEDGVISKET
jgi:uncharacterized protein CXXCG